MTKKSDKNTYAFKEIPVTVPGKFQVEAGDNVAPEVLPQLRQVEGPLRFLCSYCADARCLRQR